jgi:hypothetical protein
MRKAKDQADQPETVDPDLDIEMELTETETDTELEEVDPVGPPSDAEAVGEVEEVDLEPAAEPGLVDESDVFGEAETLDEPGALGEPELPDETDLVEEPELLAEPEVAEEPSLQELTVGPGEPWLADTSGYRERWDAIQIRFVDDPRRIVEEAGNLLSDVIEEVARTLAAEREAVETRWRGANDVSVEDLRLAFQGYRGLFDRLLAT